MSTQPTIGRVVHYVSYGSPGGEYESECRCAWSPSQRRGHWAGGAEPDRVFFDRQVRQSEENTPEAPLAMCPGRVRRPNEDRGRR